MVVMDPTDGSATLGASSDYSAMLNSAPVTASSGGGSAVGTSQPMVYFGTVHPAGATETGLGGISRGRKGISGAALMPRMLPLDQAKAHWYDMMDDGSAARWAQQMYAMGYTDNPQDLYAAHTWWDTMVAEAANAASMGHKMTPQDMAEAYKGVNRDKLLQRAEAGPGAHTSQNPINLLSEADVRAMANQIISQRLGRDASDAEVDTFFNTINAKIKKDPGSTTVVKDAAGQTVKQESTPGFDQASAQQMIDDYAQSNPEYAPLQGATTYFNAAMEALAPIGGA